jgi:uncharacterized tellurite resistance protein B-like protein
MIDLIKKFFSAQSDSESASHEDVRHDVLVATCAIFLEMAEIDDQFDKAECEHVVALLKDEYQLSDEYADELTKIAHTERSGSHDLWQFTNLINENYSNDEKIQVVELLWQLIFHDGQLSSHEQYLVTKLRKMLRLTHREVIDAKLRVLHGGSGKELR